MISRKPEGLYHAYRHAYRAAATCCLLLGIVACKSDPVAAPPEPEPKPAVQIDTKQLWAWLDEADAAIERDHLAYPEEGSAMAIFRHILQIDPEQKDARRGLERIVEKYVELAMTALNRDQFARARSMLARARIINPNHPSIEPTDEQIRLLSKAKRITVRMQVEQIDAQSAVITQELQNLAVSPAGHNCRFYIAAKNDEHGRWIYQTMSAVASGTRLRAQIDLRLPSQVERVCFPVE